MLIQRFSRLLTLLTLFCYGSFALVGSSLHTHFAAEDAETLPAASIAIPAPIPAAHPARSAASAAPVKGNALHAVRKSAHCLVCDWQAANVSAALPTHSFVFLYRPQTDIHVGAPRAPSHSALSTASRGPPSV